MRDLICLTDGFDFCDFGLDFGRMTSLEGNLLDFHLVLVAVGEEN